MTNTEPPISSSLMEQLETLHCDPKLVAGCYDYQRGFLDCLRIIKRLVNAQPTPNKEGLIEKLEVLKKIEPLDPANSLQGFGPQWYNVAIDKAIAVVRQHEVEQAMFAQSYSDLANGVPSEILDDVFKQVENDLNNIAISACQPSYDTRGRIQTGFNSNDINTALDKLRPYLHTTEPASVLLNDRPTVTIQAQTANTIGISVTTKNGTAWIVIGHDGIIITSKGLEVEVRP